jgi:hypothetical protein
MTDISQAKFEMALSFFVLRSVKRHNIARSLSCSFDLSFFLSFSRFVFLIAFAIYFCDSFLMFVNE